MSTAPESVSTELSGAKHAEMFPGQQEGERILYVIEPHGIRTFFLILKILIFVVIVGGALLYVPGKYLHISEQARIAGVLGTLLIGLFFFAGASKAARLSKTYLTDRRVVRFEKGFPFLQTRRALFWTEVAKAKAYSPYLFMRLIKVGTLEIRAKVSEDENITIPYAWYYEDLVAYIDRILYVTASKPGEISTIRPFITKPKGKRYPMDEGNSSK